MNEFAPSNKMLITALIILIAGMAALALGNIIDNSGLGILGGGTVGFSVVLIFRLVQARRNPKIAKEVAISQKDERQKQIYLYGGNTAFWLGLAGIIITDIITRTDNVILMFAPAAMLLIYVGSSIYYGKKF
jgi:hypothetical protein